MSRYETYDRAVASAFVRDRPALGSAFVRRELEGVAARAGGRPPAALDAGCGTGAYRPALATAGARVVGVDRSRAMLQAGTTRGGVQASIDRLPFPAGRFDLVLASQVLHHLEAGDDRDYRGSRRAIAELARVLRPGGRLVLNVCLEDQLAAGFWYYSLIPRARERAMRCCIPRGPLWAALADAGLTVRRTEVPDQPMQGDAYYDATGPLRAAWRRTDSIWALADDVELAAARRRVEQLRAEGELARYLADHDAPRAAVGQMTLVAAERDGEDLSYPELAGA